ncbi:hypothetical protein WA577_005203, partial [Blastocystis sp. JDR]
SKRFASPIDSFPRKKGPRGKKELSQSDDASLFLQCPICGTNIIKSLIEQHVEDCLTSQQAALNSFKSASLSDMHPSSQKEKESVLPAQSEEAHITEKKEEDVIEHQSSTSTKADKRE